MSHGQPIDLGYRARQQFYPFHTRKERFAIGVAHRRAGKTVACIMDTIDAALRCDKPNPRFAYVAPLYKQAKDVAWQYLKDFTAPIPGRTTNESELRVDLPNGARIRLYGADNPDTLRGIYLDGCVLDEYADMNPRMWGEVIRPALSDRKGWAVFIGTPKGRNEFFHMYEQAKQDDGWCTFMLRASETQLVDPVELSAAAKDMTPEQFDQEFECSFEAAIAGAYYGKLIAEAEREGRIGSVPVEPGLPIYSAWDLGISDNMAIWLWQVHADQIRIVDFYSNNSEALPHYVEWLNERGYQCEADFLPHDAKVRELGTGRTRVETLINLRRKPKLVPAHSVIDGINSARVLFPKVWIDERCLEGLEALRQYRPEYDDKKRTFRDVPLHDWTSHAADAFRYLAMAFKELKPAPKPKKRKTSLSLNDVWDRQPIRDERI